MKPVRIIRDFKINYWSGIALFNKWLGFGYKNLGDIRRFDFGFFKYYYFASLNRFCKVTKGLK